jgi:hypothetical protein
MSVAFRSCDASLSVATVPLEGCLNLRLIGHVQSHGRDALIGLEQGLTRSGVHALRVSP